MGKTLKAEALFSELKSIRKDKIIGLITGCFDILHNGHIDLLSFAESKCDILIVGVDTDTAVKRTKGDDRPINNQKIRANNLLKTKLIDYVLLLENAESFDTDKADDFYSNLCILISPNYLFTTGERDLYLEAKRKRAIMCNAELVKFKLISDVSTTKLISQGLNRKLSQHRST